MKSSSHKLERKIQRQNAIAAGAYDGRFSSKVVPNKKKKKEKLAARKWKIDVSE